MSDTSLAARLRNVRKAATAGAVVAAPGGPMAAAAGAALGGCGAAAAELVEVVASHLDSADARLQSAVREEAAQTVRDLQPELTKRLDVLIAQGAADSAVVSNFAALVEAWLAAWRQTVDDNKRKMITAGLVNALDPDAYQEGLSRELFQLATSLNYGDLFTLRLVGEEDWLSLAGRLATDTEVDLRPYTMSGSDFLKAAARATGVDPSRVVHDSVPDLIRLTAYRPYLPLEMYAKQRGQWSTSVVSPDFFADEHWGTETRGRLSLHSLANRHFKALEAHGLIALGIPANKVVPSHAVHPVVLYGTVQPTSIGWRLIAFIREPTEAETEHNGD